MKHTNAGTEYTRLDFYLELARKYNVFEHEETFKILRELSETTTEVQHVIMSAVKRKFSPDTWEALAFEYWEELKRRSNHITDEWRIDERY